MESLYIILVLHAENQQAFTSELRTLFPFGTIKFVAHQKDTLLLVSIDMEEICWTNFDVSVLFLEDKIAAFSHKHPYLKIGVLNKIGHWQMCFYDGYIMKNRQIIFEHAELYQGHAPLLKQLLNSNEVAQEDVFTTFFAKEI
ncbi:hypothetical protein H4K35_08250 [Myroides sp. NP-2]|uniref:hypothetical protein n=1 Tax=Myroides sp. NP-2 TaxID=2759945 RepID=UPI0015F83B18|nr:hypothetical protein [Myroides sp. NP-2]MBB1150119.1 hypothetical protein [Myroides sp. NP-2]